uniref:Kelch like family member 1 n=1 Tax=Aquila chrysaetos chrysaetos TaxID=223781 RepID=A0A663FB43_AQUCH
MKFRHLVISYQHGVSLAVYRLSGASHPLPPHCDMDSCSSEEFYQAVHHAEQTFRKMETYLKQQQLCDVILIAGNRKIPAHRLVLSSVSDYFAAMFTMATCDGFLYAVGGHDAPASNHCSRLLDYVERYDPKTDTWTMVAPLSMPRDAVGVCLLGDKLYAVGGYDGQTYLNTMEAYDPQTNEWTQMASLNIGRAGACVVVIKQP